LKSSEEMPLLLDVEANSVSMARNRFIFQYLLKNVALYIIMLLLVSILGLGTTHQIDL
jgi:hypothetical protein